MISTHNVLSDWNELEPQAAAAAVLPCNGSLAWASGMAAMRPLETPEATFGASDHVWRSLSEADWQQAFDSHPRIGERNARAATTQSLQWSAGEQTAANAAADTQAVLAAGHCEYEARFGRIFIICATGKSAAEILANLRQRLSNDLHTEMQEAAEQQRQITQLRLRKWLGLT